MGLLATRSLCSLTKVHPLVHAAIGKMKSSRPLETIRAGFARTSAARDVIQVPRHARARHRGFCAFREWLWSTRLSNVPACNEGR